MAGRVDKQCDVSVVQGPSDILKQLQKVRGLRNEDGQNNCFVNVIIQSLWHLDSFRAALLSMPGSPPSQPSSRACNGTATPAVAAAAGAGQKAAAPHSSPAEADVNVMLALRRIFHALDKPLQPAAAMAGSSSSSSSSNAPGQGAAEGWLVSPAELREALSALDKGAAAIEINESEMHDASEVLGEVLSALHRAEVGRAKVPSEDPQLPRRVRVAGDALLRAATDQQRAPQSTKAAAAEQQSGPSKGLTLAGIVQNGRAGGMAGALKANGVGSAGPAAAVAVGSPSSLVHKLFGLDVQVPAPVEDEASGQQQEGSQAGAAAAAGGDTGTGSKGRKKGAAAAAASGVSPGGGAAGKGSAPTGGPSGVIEVFQFMKFFHLVPAQVRVEGCTSDADRKWCLHVP